MEDARQIDFNEIKDAYGDLSKRARSEIEKIDVKGLKEEAKEISDKALKELEKLDIDMLKKEAGQASERAREISQRAWDQIKNLKRKSNEKQGKTE